MEFKKLDLSVLPNELRNEIGISICKQVTTGQSGAYTYLLLGKRGRNKYLKIIPKDLKISVKREVEILRWLEGKFPAPKVISFLSDSKYEYLLMTEVEGVPLSDYIIKADVEKSWTC